MTPPPHPTDHPGRHRPGIRALTIFAGLLALALAGCSGWGTIAPGNPAPAVDPLVGAWRSNVRFNDGSFAEIKDLEFLYVFNAGGTMTESSNYDGVPPVPPAYGIWRAAGPNLYEATYTFYTTKPPSRFDDVAHGGGWLPAGYGVLTERISMASDGRSFTSVIVLELFDPAGLPAIGGGHATGRGTRMHF